MFYMALLSDIFFVQSKKWRLINSLKKVTFLIASDGFGTSDMLCRTGYCYSVLEVLVILAMLFI